MSSSANSASVCAAHDKGTKGSLLPPRGEHSVGILLFEHSFLPDMCSAVVFFLLLGWEGQKFQVAGLRLC